MYSRRLIALFIVLFNSGSDARDEPILKHEFILPPDYRGAFKVVQDKKTGEVIAPIGGVIKVSVPASGIVVLKSTESLEKWHKAIAVYKGGTALPFGIGVLPNKESVAFFNLWTEADGTIYYFIGTKAQFDKVQKSTPWKVDEYLPKK